MYVMSKIPTRILTHAWKILKMVQNVCGFLTSFQIVWIHHPETITPITYEMADDIGIQKVS